MASKLIRTNLSDEEWWKIRQKAFDQGIPATKLVSDALRDALLKGAKP